MKKKFQFTLLPFAALCFMLLLLSCKKSPKTLESVLKDLPADAYSLSFEGVNSDPIINKTSYGSVPANIMLDIDEICPPLKKFGYKRIPPIVVGPRWPIPKRFIIVPTCPIMIPYERSVLVLEALKKSKWQFAKELITVSSGKQAVLFSQNTLADFRAIQPDSMDIVGMDKVNLDQVFVLIPEGFGRSSSMGSEQGGGGGGFSRRMWYGQSPKWKDIVIPNRQIGCLDPLELRIIKENLLRHNKVQFGGLNLQELPSGLATLSF
jgi:hypothetical protein